MLRCRAARGPLGEIGSAVAWHGIASIFPRDAAVRPERLRAVRYGMVERTAVPGDVERGASHLGAPKTVPVECTAST